MSIKLIVVTLGVFLGLCNAVPQAVPTVSPIPPPPGVVTMIPGVAVTPCTGRHGRPAGTPQPPSGRVARDMGSEPQIPLKSFNDQIEDDLANEIGDQSRISGSNRVSKKNAISKRSPKKKKEKDSSSSEESAKNSLTTPSLISKPAVISTKLSSTHNYTD